MVLHGVAREAIPASCHRARRRGRVREPRLRACRARPRRVRGPGVVGTGHRVSYEQGPGDLREDEILTQAGAAFRVFTPYKKAWMKALAPAQLRSHPVDRNAAALVRPPAGLATGIAVAVGARLSAHQPRGAGRCRRHDRRRPAVRRFSQAHRQVSGRPRLSRDQGAVVSVRAPALRHRVDPRTGGLRACAAALQRDGAGAATWLSELVWRDFYAQILWHHPHVATTSFRPEYAASALTQTTA